MGILDVMATWLTGRVGAISPPSGGAFDAAYLVRVASGSLVREVVVEFAAPSAVASGGYAEEIVRRFLHDDEPPEHVVVEIGGNVRMLTGPRDPD